MANTKHRRPRRTNKNISEKESGSKVKYVDNKVSQTTPHNDPEWYIYDRDMFDGVISMPTLEFKGKKVPWNTNVLANTAPYATRFSEMENIPLVTPTVAAYLMNPGLERSEIDIESDKYTAINVAARKMYAELSASNAKTSMYAPQDISTLILSLGQVIAMISHLKRMYGIANHFNFYSRRIPEDIFTAMHVTGYNTLKSNLSDMRSQVNRLISKVDTIMFPTGLSYFKKCEYVYQNIFVDRDEKMISYHLMAPKSTWILDEESYNQGTILKTRIVTDTSWSALIDTVEYMVENILTSSTFNYIFADILNLANRNVLNAEPISIEMLPIDYVINPVYSEQFNWQIMNMTILPMPNETEFTGRYTPYNDVYPQVNSNRLIYDPRYSATADLSGAVNVASYAKLPPIRLPDTNPSQDLFVELLAYHSIPRVAFLQTSGTHVYYDHLTDFWCSQACIVRPTDGDNQTSVTTELFSNCQSHTNWYSLCIPNQFVHFPFLYAMNYELEKVWAMPLSRMSAYTQVTPNAMANLRFETYLGLFTFRK